MEHAQPNITPVQTYLSAPSTVIVIGANTGGPQALQQILPQLPADFSSTVIVMQQMRPGFTRVLAGMLNQTCKLRVYEAEDGTPLQRSSIIIAPTGTSLTLDDSGTECTVRVEDISEDPKRLRNRTDETMTSAAVAFGPNSVGILLTGLGDDGREGMRVIAEARGLTIAQDETSSVVHDLPASAINSGAAQVVLPLWSIADGMIKFAMGDVNAAAA